MLTFCQGKKSFELKNKALDEMFAADIAAAEEEATLSHDLDGFAKGFPDWDVHPPKK